MKPLKDRMTLAKNALRLATEAQNAWRDYLAASDAATDPDPGLAEFCEAAKEHIAAMKQHADDARHRFDASPVLQARIESNGKAIRIAVSKPNEEFDTPFIGEAAYASLKHRLRIPDGGAVWSAEDFPIAVVNRQKSVVATIPSVVVMV